MTNKSLKTKGSFCVAAIAAAALFAGTMQGSALAAGGGGASLPSNSGPSVDPAASYQEGLTALQEGDFRLAERKFGEVLSVARKNPEANYYMGLAKIGVGKEKKSVRYFERAIKERPDFTEAREQLALVSITLEKPDDAQGQLVALRQARDNCARDACSAAVAKRIVSAIVTVEAALSGDTQGEEIGALNSEVFLYASDADSFHDAGEARYTDAVKLIHQERYGEAIDSLYQASAVFGPHPDILNYLGYSYRKLAAFDEARDYYGQALALDPAHLGASEYLGELYVELGDIKRARKQLARLDALCDFGCAEREDLARAIEVKLSVRSAAR